MSTQKLDKDGFLSATDEDTLNKVADALGEEEASIIIEILKKADEIIDEEIANKTGIKLNTIRKVLYKLYEHSLVSLRRTRDPKTGWFIFHWKLQPNQIEGFILSQKRRVLDKLENRLNYEKNHDFYFCKNPECDRVIFEDAVELIFKCPKCNASLMHYDNNKIVKALTEKVETLRKELGE
jgi:transcription initiation factor TFIIE subunit alpha